MSGEWVVVMGWVPGCQKWSVWEVGLRFSRGQCVGSVIHKSVIIDCLSFSYPYLHGTFSLSSKQLTVLNSDTSRTDIDVYIHLRFLLPFRIWQFPLGLFQFSYILLLLPIYLYTTHLHQFQFKIIIFITHQHWKFIRIIKFY